MVPPTVQGFHGIDPVNSSILAFPIQFLVPLIFLGIPLFLFWVRSGRIQALTPVIGKHTRQLAHATFGRDSLWSVDLWHDGPAAAVQSGHGADGNSSDSRHGCGLNFWLGTSNRPVGCTRGLWPLGLRSEVVWVDGVVSTFFGTPADYASVATTSPCFSCTTRVSTVSSSLDLCWAFSNATDDGSRRWTISRGLSTNHGSRSRSSGDLRSLYPWGGPPPLLLLSSQPLT